MRLNTYSFVQSRYVGAFFFFFFLADAERFKCVTPTTFLSSKGRAYFDYT